MLVKYWFTGLVASGSILRKCLPAAWPRVGSSDSLGLLIHALSAPFVYLEPKKGIVMRPQMPDKLPTRPGVHDKQIHTFYIF